ncbi:LacI family DNA-binding transcriptional regulator [Phytohabitans sp. ZYX-F-186]|uniref:LacI family DNA-binding transcriptional regulator n=1 Tax=Phytohabitans maris TaxID=3071409 RepID=A0ABU0ZVC8_9ACTN|nr:LacI family DNA-binding transcriptional regulator [Phytohabitans sp. ZYX-F-186]MDQ7909892.1 LacI family DNA-binding transcriptional regulator [Phytohabitans sp. ZYX-F-186]
MDGAAGRRGRRTSGPTLHDVAREAGVSVATASRAFNGSSTRNVKPEYISRVLAAAERIGYQPHLSAQAIALGSTRTAALVVSDIDDPYFSSIAAGVITAAQAQRLIPTVAIADRSPDRELQIVRTLRGQRPRVIIIAGSRIDGSGTDGALSEELEAYQAAGGRVVLVSQEGLPFSTVAIDNGGGARALAEALVGRGYRRFGVLCAAPAIRTSHDRCGGFLAGLAAAGVPDPTVVETAFTRAGGYDATHELLRGGRPTVDAVVAVNDVMAIGAMTAIRDAGLVPGRDVGVAGFDDISWCADLDPALSTVAVPLHEVGVTAMRLALGDDRGVRVVPVATSVVLRDSTPPR